MSDIKTFEEIVEGELVDFGMALDAVKEGAKVRRKHWRDGTYVNLIEVVEDSSPITTSYIAISVWDGTCIPWVATQSDLLEEDWQVL